MGMNEPCPRPLNLGAMSRRLRVPAKWLRAEADAGRIPHLRAGRVLLFDPDTVEQIILDRLRATGSKEVTRE